jgi:hypothetical protein
LTKSSILVILKPDEKFTIYTDASQYGLGGVLIQEGRVVAYAFRQFKNHEQNYPTHLNFHQHKWLELIQDYDIQINYHPGKTNRVADTLSRKSYLSNIGTELLKELEKTRIEVLTNNKS